MTAGPAASLSGSDVGLFGSDVHLDEHDPSTADLFFGLLRAAAADASHVFLLGDLFETWIGDDDDAPLARRARDELTAVASGARLFLMRGNRDFLLDAPDDGASRFSAAIGATMLDDPARIDAFGEPVLLGHGDAWCTDDHDYQRFRAQTRTVQWARSFLSHPLAERRAIAADLRARSRAATQDKVATIMDVNRAAVADAMLGAGVRTLVHGHTHRPACHHLQLDGGAARRWVLPDWSATDGRGGLLRVSARGWETVGEWPAAAAT